jgi:extradiol dioxygenase family protein
MSDLRPFHLAIPVEDLGAARAFYGKALGCAEGRSDTHWVDFNFFGHQLVCHVDPTRAVTGRKVRNAVDGDPVPVPHFGVVLTMKDWEALRQRLVERDVYFDIEPRIRFKGRPGAQATMFFTDPSGNTLEFKAFDADQQIFAKQP